MESNKNSSGENIPVIYRAYKRLKKFVAKLDLKRRLKNLFYQFRKTLSSSTGLFILFFLSLALLSFLGIYYDNVRMLSLAGLSWMAVWLSIFILSLSTTQSLASFESSLNDFLEKEENEFNKLVAVGINWLVITVRKWAFTIAGLAIALSFIFAKFHYNAVIDGFEKFFKFKETPIGVYIFTISVPIIGLIIDLSSIKTEINKRKKGHLIYLIGIPKFYSVSLFFISGIIGGKITMDAISRALSKPINVINRDILLGEYGESVGCQIYQGMGGFLFGLFYFFIPLFVLLSCRKDLKRIRENEETVLSKGTLRTIIATSLLFMFISLYVGYFEGWIENILMFILSIFEFIIHQVMRITQYLAEKL